MRDQNAKVFDLEAYRRNREKEAKARKQQAEQARRRLERRVPDPLRHGVSWRWLGLLFLACLVLAIARSSF